MNNTVVYTHKVKSAKVTTQIDVPEENKQLFAIIESTYQIGKADPIINKFFIHDKKQARAIVEHLKQYL